MAKAGKNASLLAKPTLILILSPGWRVPLSLLRLVSQQGDVGDVESVLASSRQSETGPLKDEFSGALTRDMVCVRK